MGLTVGLAQGEVANKPQKLRNGCSKLYEKHEFKQYARGVYRRKVISRKAQRRVKLLIVCQHSDTDQQWAEKRRAQYLKLRRQRQAMRCGTPTCNVKLAWHIAEPKYGKNHANCLIRLGSAESAWRTNASNPSSGAYGIPQSLPGSKMASHGADWRTNPETQIRWMIDYSIGRYGSLCGAANSQASQGWY